MQVPRRQFLQLVGAAGALPLLSSGSQAQSWPTRAITLIVPFAAGGATDVAARIIGEHMSRTLGRQIVIQNAPGAGGTVGSTRAMRAEPDGYTILMGHVGTHAVAVPLYPNLGYKPDVDFEPIGLVSEFPMLIVGGKDFPPKDLTEFVAYVKTNADKLNVGHAGVRLGLFQHLPAAAFDPARKADPGAVQWRAACDECVGGRADRLSLRRCNHRQAAA